MKILVCLDGSQHAKGVIGPAARLAEESHSEVHLLSVVDLSQVHERPRGFAGAALGRAVDLSGGIVPRAVGGSGEPRGRDEPDLVEDRDQALTRARDEALDALRLEAHRFPSPVYVEVVDSDCAATAITVYARSHAIDPTIAGPGRGGHVAIVRAGEGGVLRLDTPRFARAGNRHV